MKIGALGLVTVAIGVALSSTGLVAIGAFWVVAGAVGHALRPRMVVKPEAGTPPPKGKILLGVAVMLSIGIPSLLVGILRLGIDDGDAAWRWLPLVVGIITCGFGASTALLLGAASGLTAVASSDAPDEPEPTGVDDRLVELERLLRDEQITLDEYQAQRERILGSL